MDSMVERIEARVGTTTARRFSSARLRDAGLRRVPRRSATDPGRPGAAGETDDPALCCVVGVPGETRRHAFGDADCANTLRLTSSPPSRSSMASRPPIFFFMPPRRWAYSPAELRRRRGQYSPGSEGACAAGMRVIGFAGGGHAEQCIRSKHCREGARRTSSSAMDELELTTELIQTSTSWRSYQDGLPTCYNLASC